MDKEKNSIERQKFNMIKTGFDIIGKWLEKIANKEERKVEVTGVSLITIKGDKGDPGKTPTDKELLALIKPLIPVLKQPEDGKTPTEAELLKLIKPLIPYVKDGETPSDERLLSLITPLIKEVDTKPIIEEVRKLTVEDLKKIIPASDTAEEIIKKLLSIKKAWLPAEAIDGDIVQHITRIVKQFGGSGSGGISEERVIEIINANSTFLKLTDTPDTYAGQTGKAAVVNATEDGLVFATISGTDEKVKYDASDPTAGYVADKIVAGTGITVAEGTGGDENKLKITNSAPDQTVSISAGTNIDSVTGTYPNFTINAATQGSTYTLPIASATTLGGVKVGSGLSIDSGTGVLTASGTSGLNYVTQAFTSQTTITFVHNLGAYPIIQVIDDTGAVVIPVSITNTSVNSATVVFSSSTTGTIIGSMGSSAFGLSEAVRSKSFTITNPTAGATYAIWKTPAGITITSVEAVQIGGTNLVGSLTECDADGLNPVAIDGTDMTITTSNTNKTSFSNPSIDSGDWVGWSNTSISGAVSRLMVTFTFQ